jgi:hypothetical protein
MINKVKGYSKNKKSIVEWDVKKKKERDEGDNEHEFFEVTHGDEVHRISPNATDEEIKTIMDNVDKQHQ